jgi:DNA repair protein RecN (Recombination protein N)
VEIDIKVKQTDKFTHKGLDDIDILISFNKGFSPLSIRDIISGGEASRLSLAFKLLKNDGKILVLDEIETGLSGNTLLELSNALKKISNECQVICVTHSQEIINNATNKIEVYKTETESKAETKIKQC